MDVSRKSTNLAAVLLVALLAGELTCLGCHALDIANKMKHSLTWVNPPGCCAPPCPPKPPCIVRQVCVQCASVVVEAGQTRTISPRIGPYPLQHLKLHVDGEVIRCVGEKDLELITKSSRLAVGPEHCGIDKRGFQASISGNSGASKILAQICILPCS